MKILSFGSLNADYVYEVPHIIQPGETMTSLGRSTHAGGKGLNSTVALARAGADVHFAGTIGEDGEWLVDVLKDAGADTSLVDRIPGPSGHTIIQVDPEAENCILVFPGSNRQNSIEHIDDVLSHFGEGDFLVLQNEINDLPYIMEWAKRQGMKIVLNPSPCDEIIETLPLDTVDYLIVNEAEAETLAASGSGPAEDTLTVLAAMYPEAEIVVTLGSAGALYSKGETRIRQAAFPAAPVDTTGAGDTFLGYFVAGTAEGLPPEEALRLAAAAASIAVSREGAAPSIPARDEVNDLL